MEKFATIYDHAAERHGDRKHIESMMPKASSKRALANTENDRWLAEMTRCVFQAGFVWRVVNQKWNDFEDVFFGFPPERIVMLGPEQVDRISQNPRIIRNRQKVLTVQNNAQFILDISKEHESFGKFVSRWPQDDLIGLFTCMKKHGALLGGMTGQRVLRTMGKDTFVLTGDVVKCLRRAKLDITNNPNKHREMKLIQEALNHWHAETDLPYSHLSRIGALSVG